MKEYRWEGRTVEDTLKEGEANSRDEGVENALAAGCINYTISRNAGYNPEVHGRETQVLPAAGSDPQSRDDDLEAALDAGKPVLETGQGDKDLQGKSDLQVLAQANATLFRQSSELKDALHAMQLENGVLAGQVREQAQKMQDVKEAAIAWFTEYQAAAMSSGSPSAPGDEPVFMALLRAF